MPQITTKKKCVTKKKHAAYRKNTNNRERKVLYAPFEESNFVWYWDEVELVALKALWNRDFTLLEMAEIFKRDSYEVLFILLDRLEHNEISKRAIGLGVAI